MTTPPRRPSAAARATRRSRRPAPRRATFLERNRSRLLWIAGGLGFLLIAGVAFYQFTRPVYACSNIFEPTPAPSFVPGTPEPVASGETPAPAPTAPPLGYIQPDMGHVHADPGSFVRYTYCPPASGRHYNAVGLGPIRPGLYGPGDPAAPNGWVHNLEHGALVILYRGDGAGATDAGQAALEALAARMPNSPICNTASGVDSPVMARFDDMPWPYAAIVWDVVLPMQELDEELVLEFYRQRAEQFNPELKPGCVRPTPTPGPTAPAPSGSPAPSAAGSPGASPAGSPGASPAASPAASGAPASS